jgi:hypothetical protein
VNSESFKRRKEPLALACAAVLAASAREPAAAPDDQVRFDGKRLRGAMPGKVKPLLVAATDSAGRALDQILAADSDDIGAARADRRQYALADEANADLIVRTAVCRKSR